MKLTTKGRYAVTAMLDLALHNNEAPISLSDIADRQQVSLSYLEQLFAKLRRSNIITSTRGPGGGYSLNRSSAEISVVEIILAVDEEVDSTRCGGFEDCQDNLKCLTHNLWEDLSNQIRIFLGDISLDELMQHEVVQQISARQNKAGECGKLDRQDNL